MVGVQWHNIKGSLKEIHWMMQHIEKEISESTVTLLSLLINESAATHEQLYIVGCIAKHSQTRWFLKFFESAFPLTSCREKDKTSQREFSQL